MEINKQELQAIYVEQENITQNKKTLLTLQKYMLKNIILSSQIRLEENVLNT